MFKALAGVSAALVCLTGPQIPEARAAADCSLQENGTLICVRQISASVDRLGVRDPQGQTEFIGDITCTADRWILHGNWTGYVSYETAREYAKAYCEGRGDMFASLPSVLA